MSGAKRTRGATPSLLAALAALVSILVLSCTVQRPPATNVPTAPPAPTATPTQPPRLEPGDLIVALGADRAAAMTGDALTFTVTLTNTTVNTVMAGVVDTLPADLGLVAVQHACLSAAILTSSHSLSATVTVPPSSSCGLVVTAVVSEGCNCAVVNQVSWSAGGLDGRADSPAVQLSLPTIGYPAVRDALTDLNPIYAPFITTTADWTLHNRTSYDRTAGNADYFARCQPPEVTDRCCTVAASTVCTWTIVPTDVSGLLIRLQMAQAVVAPPFLDTPAAGRVELFSPPAAQQPVATLDLSRLITYTDYPLVMDGVHSSGGIVIYKPFRFNQGLKIRSSGIDALNLFEFDYVETPPTTATVGWVDSPITSTWQPGSMGQTVDRLSVGAPAFRGIHAYSSSLTLSPASNQLLFADPGAGTIVKIAFSGVERPGVPSTALSLFAGIELHVRYGDADDASVDLPLDWLFLSPRADYTPEQPPTHDLGAMAFGPTGNHVIVAGDSAWVLEAPAYDVAWQQYGTADGIAPWYRASLAKLLEGPGAQPPVSGVDTYSLHSLLGEGAAIIDQGEWVTKGPLYWSRGLTQTAWTSGTLQEAWGKDINHPPTDSIDCQTYSFDTGLLPSALMRYIIRGDEYWSTAITLPYTLPHTVTWKSGPLADLLPFYEGGGVDTFAVSRLGEIVTSGSRFWFCRAGEDCRLRESWAGPTPLSDAWWMDKWPNGNDKVYGSSLFYGYDRSRREYYLTLPMPYRDGISVTLSNASAPDCLSCTVSLTVGIEYTPQEYGASAGYLDIHAVEGSSGTHLPVWPNSVLATTLRGRGKLLGLVQRARGPVDPNWGRTFLEGDTIIAADTDEPLCQEVDPPALYRCECDHRDTYVQCGTGMENSNNSGWFFLQGPYYLPTHGVPRTMPNYLLLPPIPPYSFGWAPNLTYPYKYSGEINRRAGPGYADADTRMYRFLLNDAIRFQRWLHLGVEFQFTATDSRWNVPPAGQAEIGVTLGVLTIAYIAPGSAAPPSAGSAGE